MSNESDPGAVTDALAAAIDAFNEEGHGAPTPERQIDIDAEWKTQLTKGCRLLRVLANIDGKGYFTAEIELCFGAIERSLEAFALAEGGDELREFHDHTYCYERAGELGLLSRSTAETLAELYTDNRADSYYGGRRPTGNQAKAMHALAEALHHYTKNQIRAGGVCACDS
ncbi:DNA-binding protein [Salinarchaeum laminariae]|uniref:DNA-binding protein n=1 Tax=Salinarchaeum laminariae TaxID=869888 RepID=UPI0020C09A86|nr:DNA-binding protein [Salinarchaeum laminariae]